MDKFVVCFDVCNESKLLGGRFIFPFKPTELGVSMILQNIKDLLVNYN